MNTPKILNEQCFMNCQSVGYVEKRKERRRRKLESHKTPANPLKIRTQRKLEFWSSLCKRKLISPLLVVFNVVRAFFFPFCFHFCFPQGAVYMLCLQAKTRYSHYMGLNNKIENILVARQFPIVVIMEIKEVINKL